MKTPPEESAHIVLGVTGSVAAFKAVELAGLMVKAGYAVSVIMTESAQRFVGPLSFEAVTHRTVYTGLFDDHDVEPRHIGLAERADALVIAPATANIIGKMAGGLADDLLSCVAMATRAPVVVAPAMNDGMYTHPATQANIRVMSERAVRFVGPEVGRLASGKTGAGRMSDPPKIMDAVRDVTSGSSK